MNKLLIALVIILLAIGGGIFFVIRPDSYLPHEKITIRVPYEFTDVPDSMIPMGETINHPKPRVPHGHPGIDFQYNSSALHNVIASADGTVTSITQGASNEGKWDVEIRNGFYLLRYKEMENYNPAFHYGYKVKEGEIVGHYGIYKEKDGFTHEQIHWELASVSLIEDRFCPLTYFDTPSLKSINELWAKVPAEDNQNMKKQFPDICSGDYYGKEEGDVQSTNKIGGELATKYISGQEWPPKITTATGSFSCKEGGSEIQPGGVTAKKTINGRIYCITTQSEGAAGSVYTTHTYSTTLDFKNLITLNFVLRYPQCANYSDPQKTECLNERKTFDLDGLVDRIVMSAR